MFSIIIQDQIYSFVEIVSNQVVSKKGGHVLSVWCNNSGNYTEDINRKQQLQSVVLYPLLSKAAIKFCTINVAMYCLHYQVKVMVIQVLFLNTFKYIMLSTEDIYTSNFNMCCTWELCLPMFRQYCYYNILLPLLSTVDSSIHVILLSLANTSKGRVW